MAKYNLLDDDDIFDDNDDLLKDDEDSDVADLLNEVDEQQEEITGIDEAEPETPETPAAANESDAFDIDIDDELLNFEPSEDLDASTFSEEEDLDISSEAPVAGVDIPEPEPEPEPKPVEDEQPAEEPAPKKEASTVDLSMDFEDEKQEGINYKPIVMGISGIILLILIYIGVDHFFLSGPTDEPVTDNPPAKEETTGNDQQKPQSAAEAQKQRAEQEKQKALKDISSENNQRVSQMQQVIGAIGKDARLSSLLLYDENLLFEVYAPDRAGLARYNMALKEKNLPFKLVSSSGRPGSKGGILGVYKGKVTGSGSGNTATIQQVSSINALESALKTKARSAGLSVRNVKSRSMASLNKKSLKGYEINMEMSGSLDATKKFIASLGAMSQVRVYKWVESAQDQSAFSSKNYRVQLILHAFI
ncbi:MAG: hypothetical protein D6677_08415 [Calditrichaeota bacterium]|nr:MAG: hypothetical protein D6677_08415 [Calditrichota bacterium]